MMIVGGVRSGLLMPFGQAARDVVDLVSAQNFATNCRNRGRGRRRRKNATRRLEFYRGNIPVGREPTAQQKKREKNFSCTIALGKVVVVGMQQWGAIAVATSLERGATGVGGPASFLLHVTLPLA